MGNANTYKTVLYCPNGTHKLQFLNNREKCSCCDEISVGSMCCECFVFCHNCKKALDKYTHNDSFDLPKFFNERCSRFAKTLCMVCYRPKDYCEAAFTCPERRQFELFANVTNGYYRIKKYVPHIKFVSDDRMC